MQKARRHPTKGLRPLVSVWFQVLFHPVIHGTFHLSFTVLVHYRLSNVFSLGKWPSQIPTGFLVSRRTQEHCRSLTNFAYGAVTLFGLSFQKGSAIGQFCNFYLQVLQPRRHIDDGLGCSPFARHY